MLSNDFLLKDARGLELEIERHCAGLGLDCTREFEVRQYVQEMLHNMAPVKEAAKQGDRTAMAKVELYGMVMMLHQANIKAFGPDYMTKIDELAQQESSWVAFARAMWNELGSAKSGQ